MTDLYHSNRRTVLKTLGAGVVGGTVLTGTAAADVGDVTIEIKDNGGGGDPTTFDEFEFDPAEKTINLASGESKEVDWDSPSSNGHTHDVTFHNVDLQSGELVPGASYQVKLTNNGDGTLTVEETGFYGNWTDVEDENRESVTVNFDSGSRNLNYFCSFHPNMEGTLKVRE